MLSEKYDLLWLEILHGFHVTHFEKIFNRSSVLSEPVTRLTCYSPINCQKR